METGVTTAGENGHINSYWKTC